MNGSKQIQSNGKLNKSDNNTNSITNGHSESKENKKISEESNGKKLNGHHENGLKNGDISNDNKISSGKPSGCPIKSYAAVAAKPSSDVNSVKCAQKGI